jgi:hypothetical protein
LEPKNEEDWLAGRVDRLERQGILRRATASKVTVPPGRVRTTDGASAVDVVVEERREGR